MTEIRAKKALEAAAPVFVEKLRRGGTLTPENWLAALWAAEIPGELAAEIPGCPESHTEKDKRLYETCLKLRLLAAGLEIGMREREWQVMDYRLGFADGLVHTRAETGAHFGVSENRIRMIEDSFIRRIRMGLLRGSGAGRDFFGR